MQPPSFTLLDVQNTTSPAIFDRALALVNDGKIESLEDTGRNYTVTVQGSENYNVVVPYQNIHQGTCTCYMGQRNIPCKHLLAAAYTALQHTGTLEKIPFINAEYDLTKIKATINSAMHKITPNHSSTTNKKTYQKRLTDGAGMICSALQHLPPTEAHAKYVGNVVKRLDRKIDHGVDDSNGTIANCIATLVAQLMHYANVQPLLLNAIRSSNEHTRYYKLIEQIK